MPVCKSRQQWRKREKEERECVGGEIRLPSKATVPETSILWAAFLSQTHTCELTHQALVDKPTSHLHGIPRLYMATLQGPSVT